jgi:protein TonB
MIKRRYSLLTALAGVATLTVFSFSAQQTDPFYLNILEKAQKSFLAKNYPEAARSFEIAAFGLAGNKTLQAKAYVYLGLCRYYLKDMQGSEKSLREASAIIGEAGFASLEIYESAWPDLDKQSPNEAVPKEVEKPLPPDPPLQKAKPNEPAKKPEDKKNKDAAKEVETATAAAPPINLNIDEIKEGGLMPIDMVETRPTLIKSIPAVYPAHARSLRIEGTVLINVLISEKGDVIDTEIIRGIKNAVGFDQSALKAVRQWKFEPASVKGIKVKVWMRVAVEFRISPAPPE